MPNETDEVSPSSLPPNANCVMMSALPALIFLNFSGVTSLHT